MNGPRDERLIEFMRWDYPRLVAALITVTGAQSSAEDVVQDALVRVLAVSRRGREVDSFSALVRATALNLAKNRWRSLSRERSALARFKEQDKDRTTVTAAADDGLDFGGALLSLPLASARRRRCSINSISA
jgi:DNA-directed RNA polymerase specialized sigma24 family protein